MTFNKPFDDAGETGDPFQQLHRAMDRYDLQARKRLKRRMIFVGAALCIALAAISKTGYFPWMAW